MAWHGHTSLYAYKAQLNLQAFLSQHYVQAPGPSFEYREPVRRAVPPGRNSLDAYIVQPILRGFLLDRGDQVRAFSCVC